MPSQLKRRAAFLLERWLHRGLPAQLALMVALVALLTVLGGAAGWAVSAQFESPLSALWWAFLRLTDPGYLGDDEGRGLRTVSTVLTVAGVVVFYGSLVAVLTQWLTGTVQRLQRGLSEVSLSNHVVVLGWTNRTPELLLRLIAARGRLTRFLERRGTRKLRLVVLVDEVSPELRQNLNNYLGRWARGANILLRTGNSLRFDDLERLDLPRAAAVLVPGADFELGGSGTSDARVLKTLLSVETICATHAIEERPLVVAEVLEPGRIDLGRMGERGGIELIASDQVLGRLIAQSVRHPGLAPILTGLGHHDGSAAFYLAKFPQLAGLPAPQLFEHFPRAIPLGAVCQHGEQRTADFDPGSQHALEAGDWLVMLADKLEDCSPQSGEAGALITPRARDNSMAMEQRPLRRVLVLGWSHRLGVLLAEFDEEPERRFEVCVLSRVPAGERKHALAPLAIDPAHVRVSHVEGDPTLCRDLGAVHPENFAFVLFLASGLECDSDDADARTILGHATLQGVLAETTERPEICVELLDADNARLLEGSGSTPLVSPRLISQLLADVALRPELHAVYTELYGTTGSEVQLASPDELGLELGSCNFRQLQRRTLERGRVLIGVLEPGTPAHLNPRRDLPLELGPKTQLVVIGKAG